MAEEEMKHRNLRRLNKLHLYAHRRFHEATRPDCWNFWLDVRTKIISLILAQKES